MTVLEVKLYKSGAKGSAKGSGGAAPSYDYTATYHVKCSGTDSPREVMDYFKADKSLPWPGRAFAANGFDNSSTCSQISADYVEASGDTFLVTATYTPESGEGKQQRPDKDGKMTDDPTKWRDEIDIGSTQMFLPMEFATYVGPRPRNEFLKPGRFQAVTNSAGEPFDPLPEYELDITVLRITKYGEAWNEDFIAPYRGTINKDHVRINKPNYNFFFQFGPFQGKMKEWAGTAGFANEKVYWKHNIELHVSPVGWRFPLLDKGTTTIGRDPDDATNYGKVIRLKDQSDYPLTSPILLNGNGEALPKGQDPVVLLYARYSEVNYSDINW